MLEAAGVDDDLQLLIREPLAGDGAEIGAAYHGITGRPVAGSRIARAFS